MTAISLCGCLSLLCHVASSKLLVGLGLLVVLQSNAVAAGPIAYATCQAAAASGCALTGPAFLACQCDTEHSRAAHTV